jgi:hypothetical protein
MKRSEKVGDCGCQLVRDGTGLRMIDCPLHKAAPDLLEACKEAKPALDAMPCTCNEDRDCQRCHALRKINQALAKAEKGE